MQSLPVPRWKITNGAVRAFTAMVAPPSLMLPASVRDMERDITTRFHDAALSSVTRTSGRRLQRKTSPWWTVEYQDAVSRRRRALHLLLRCPMPGRLIEYKPRLAEARNCLVRHKRAYKRSFLSSITFTTPLSVAWRRVKLLRSTSPLPTYPLLDNCRMLMSTSSVGRFRHSAVGVLFVCLRT